MISVLKAFLITCFLTILSSTNITAQCNSSSAIGYVLVGHVYRNFSGPGPLQCYSACKAEEPKCRSFNFHADKNICELNNHSRESRPADIIPSQVAVYFHSCYRDRLGSIKALAANSCAEILDYEDSVGDGWYWVRTDTTGNESAKIFCNMKNGGIMSSSFDLIFPTTRNNSNYVMIDATFGDLTAFTVSLWLKSTEKILVPISYAVGNMMNAILVYLDDIGFLRFLVADNQLDGEIGNLDDDAWHHVSATWDNTMGHAQIFIDGALKLNTMNIASGITIAGRGKMVLGQDQDILGGGFDVRQSFAGELTHVYLWNTALSAEVIIGMSRVCREFPYPGHVLGWKDFGSSMYGGVSRRNLSRCHFDRPL